MKNALALSAAAIALLLTPVARAGVITPDVSATLTPDFGAACSPTCTLGGDIVINNSAPAPGEFSSAHIIATGFSPSVGPFTETSLDSILVRELERGWRQTIRLVTLWS